MARMVRIIGTDGRTVSEFPVSGPLNRIDISKLNTGMHVLQVFTERGVLHRSFVKMD